MGLQTPWAILRCKWNDIDDEPLSDEYVQNMFTTAGAGTLNMVDYFDKMSHGNVDLSGSQVFGWFTLPNPHTDSPAYVVNTEDEPLKVTKAQNWLVDLARGVAMTNDVPVNDFPHGVVLMNTNQGILFGQQGVGPLSATGATVSRACSGRKWATLTVSTTHAERVRWPTTRTAGTS